MKRMGHASPTLLTALLTALLAAASPLSAQAPGVTSGFFTLRATAGSGFR